MYKYVHLQHVQVLHMGAPRLARTKPWGWGLSVPISRPCYHQARPIAGLAASRNEQKVRSWIIGGGEGS